MATETENALTRCCLFVLGAPATVVARAAHRAFLWSYANQRAKLLERGEKLLAYDSEVDPEGYFWVASNRAVYVERKDTDSNRRQRKLHTDRWPYGDIKDVAERNDGSTRERVLTVVGETLAARQITGRFRNRRSLKMTDVIRNHLAT